VQEFERKQLIERIEREGATVGEAIPESISIQGETIDLREFVFEIQRRETVPAGERDRVEQAKRNLRRERRQRRERIEAGEVSYEEGKTLATAVVGIDRALHALENLGPTDLAAEADAQTTADRKRWVNFLKQALGQDDSNSGVGVGRGR
jgi:hypothetical protein